MRCFSILRHLLAIEIRFSLSPFETLNTAFASEKYFLLLKFRQTSIFQISITIFPTRRIFSSRSYLLEYVTEQFYKMFTLIDNFRPSYKHGSVISRMANATCPDRPESNLILVEQIIRSHFGEYFIPIYDHLSIYLSLLNLIKNHQ